MNGAVGMGTAAEGKEMGRILLRYYYGRRVDDQDRIVLDRLCRAAFIDFYRKDGVLYARASKVGRCLEPTFRSRMRLLLGRVRGGVLGTSGTMFTNKATARRFAPSSRPVRTGRFAVERGLEDVVQ